MCLLMASIESSQEQRWKQEVSKVEIMALLIGFPSFSRLQNRACTNCYEVRAENTKQKTNMKNINEVNCGRSRSG